MKTSARIMVVILIASLIIGVHVSVTTTKPAVTKPTHKLMHLWNRSDSLSFASDQINIEADKQFTCLQNLWGKESGWNPKAKNLVKSQGLNAGGIPQLLGMSPLTPPTKQIVRGLRYITYRYTTPCKAWEHWQRNGWY